MQHESWRHSMECWLEKWGASVVTICCLYGKGQGGEIYCKAWVARGREEEEMAVEMKVLEMPD